MRQSMVKKVTKNSNAQPGSETKEQLRAYYTSMLKIRRFEEKTGQLYGMGLIGGFCHLYIGQEAVVVGMQSCTKPGDRDYQLSRSWTYDCGGGGSQKIMAGWWAN